MESPALGVGAGGGGTGSGRSTPSMLGIWRSAPLLLGLVLAYQSPRVGKETCSATSSLVVGNGNGASVHKVDEDDGWDSTILVLAVGTLPRVLLEGSVTVQPSQPQPARAKSKTLWDLDEFASSSSTPTAPSLAPPAPTSRSSSLPNNNKGKTKPKPQEHVDNRGLEDTLVCGVESRVNKSGFPNIWFVYFEGWGC
jgi:hypothetical protein